MHLILVPHPETPPTKSFEVWATIEHAAAFGAMATTSIWFGVRAPARGFVIPERTEQGRVDGLWRSTCFEVFFRPAGAQTYREWNFAPSTQWAAYDFSARREGMTRPEISKPPYIRVEDNLTWWCLGATIAVEAEVHWELALSAVLEEQDATTSYWALAHGDGPPDFHNPDCFIARLP